MVDELLDAFHAYLHDCHVYPLLTAVQEHDLGLLIALGHAEEANPACAHDQASIARGVNASTTLTQHNLGLVISVARGYLGRGLDLPDLVQEGNIGLMRASTDFDAARGTRFSTYATFWIRQAIIRAVVDRGQAIRLPVWIQTPLTAVKAATQRYASEHQGDQPDVATLAAMTGLPPGRVQQCHEAQRLRQIRSLDVPDEGDRSGLPLGHVLPHPDDELTDAIARYELTDEVRTLVRAAALTAREVALIRLRFGLDAQDERTLDEVGVVLGLTRERVRQIEVIALRKLRQAARQDHGIEQVG